MNKRYYFTTLAANLERALHDDVGLKGLLTLVSGWTKMLKRHGKKVRFDSTLRRRKKVDGEEWLSPNEALSLSKYAQYDLTK